MNGELRVLYFQPNLVVMLRRLSEVVVFVASIAGIASHVAANEFVTPQNLTRTLHSKDIDSIRRAMNEIKRQHYKGEIIPFIADLWTMDRSKRPDLPWNVIEIPPVRLEVADILVQAARNGYIDLDIAPMHAFARSQT